MAAQDDRLVQQEQAYAKAIKSIQTTLEHPQEYLETFVIKEIMKIGEAYSSLKNEVKKWARLGNAFKKNAKNKELGTYVSTLRKYGMYSTLCKLLSPTLGHTKAIQIATCKTLSIIAHRPNVYRDAEWYDNKQRLIALNPLYINGSQYNTLLLISHILSDHKNAFKYENLNLRCCAIQLIANLVNHNSKVTFEINKQFPFISMILNILNDEELFELTLNKNKNKKKMNGIALLTFINGLSCCLNMMQHNESNKMKFNEMNGWLLICKCLTHSCIQLRQLSFCFINLICVNHKLSAKYLLNTKYETIESFKILLNILHNICLDLNKEIGNINKNMDTLLCKLICSLSSLLCENMIGNRKFCMHKAWINIFKLIETINNLNQHSTYHISDELHFQIFSLLSSFNIPSKEKWKVTQYDPMFKNIENNQNKQTKKLTMKERKLKQKRDEMKQHDEYKKTQRIIKENIRMLGGYKKQLDNNKEDNQDMEIEEDNNMDEEDEYDREIVLKYLFESLAKKRFVIGAICALGKLCKIKYNGNMNRLNEIIGEFKIKNKNKYDLSIKGIKARMNENFIKCHFPFNKNKNENLRQLNDLIYFVSGVNDLFDVITINIEEEKEKEKEKEKQENDISSNNIRDLFLDSQIIYVLCMIITQSTQKYFEFDMNDMNSNKDEDINPKLFEDKIKDLKLNTCYGLAKVIKNDIKIQKRFGQWIPRISAALKDLATDPVDTSFSQIALAHVLYCGCFTPINNENIKQLHDKQRPIHHMLRQLYKETRITT